MADPDQPEHGAPSEAAASGPTKEATPTPQRTRGRDDKVLCERCGAEMFRMHAVWRCPECRFKTDCCGW